MVLIMNNTSHRVSFKEIGYHVLFWLTYIASEYFANLIHMAPGRNLAFFKSILFTLPLLMIPAYFIALYVVPRYLKTDKWSLFILWILAVGVFVFFARIKWQELLYFLESGEYFKMPASKMLKNIIRDYATIALGVCIYIIGDYRKKQKHNEQLMKSKAEAEIKLLKGQLHPHFLFNSLNNIYSLALMKSDLTADSILKLTELLDYLVYRANLDKVALSKEVQLLKNYIELEKLRYGDKLKIDEDIQMKNESLRVAPLILLPFAENCFKHGGPGQDGIFMIRILLHTQSNKLLFNIVNSKKRKNDSSAVQGGIGLDNIRQRLNLLYPGRHQLMIKDDPETYNVSLEIEFKDDHV
jgi:two-component system, LytTR family, sensor kinase